MMSQDTPALLARIAEALERLAPHQAAPPSFDDARLYRYDGGQDRFAPAADYALALDLLVGVERQKARFVENLTRFAEGLPSNHALLWDREARARAPWPRRPS